MKGSGGQSGDGEGVESKHLGAIQPVLRLLFPRGEVVFINHSQVSGASASLK